MHICPNAQAVSGYLPFSATKKAHESQDTEDRSTIDSFKKERSVNIYQSNGEDKGPIPLTEEEAPTQINDFVLTCLNAKPEERFDSAAEMLAAWDDAMTKALASTMEKAEHSEASQFWKDNFGIEGDELGVEVPRFVQLFCEKYSISAAAGNKLALMADADGNGTLTREEFLQTFSKYGMKELAEMYRREAEEEAASQPVGEPANSYHGQGKRLVFTDVKYKSKGTSLGFSKDRIGTLTMEHGAIEARRFESGKSYVVYRFDIQSSMLDNFNPSSASLEIATPADKPRTFTFQSTADRNQFAQAFHTTKTWISG
jgi:hypothetical protein